MSAQPADRELRWYNNPDRPCKDKAEYGDLTLTYGRGSGDLRKRMALACVSCPVLSECREDLQAKGEQGYLHYGIQAGIQGKT